MRWPTHRDITVTETVLKSWIENYKDKTFYQWGIVLKEIDEPIGTISVVDMDEKTSKVHIGSVSYTHLSLEPSQMGSLEGLR